MGTKDDFIRASEQVKTLKSKPNNEELLQLYSLYKQATQGDVRGEKPSRLNFKERAKYEAWESKKGFDSQLAMNEYIKFVENLFNKNS